MSTSNTKEKTILQTLHTSLLLGYITIKIFIEKENEKED